MTKKPPAPPRPYASPACYAHEVDPDYMWAAKGAPKTPPAKKPRGTAKRRGPKRRIKPPTAGA